MLTKIFIGLVFIACSAVGIAPILSALEHISTERPCVYIVYAFGVFLLVIRKKYKDTIT
jgi:hypothetical protein